MKLLRPFFGSFVTLLLVLVSGVSLHAQEDVKKRLEKLEDSLEELREDQNDLEQENERLREQLDKSDSSSTDGPTLGNPFEGPIVKGKNFTFDVGGRLMVDYVLSSVDEEVSDAVEGFHSDGDATDSAAEFRRARLFASGTYREIGYKLQLDFAGGTSIKDAYLDFPSPLPSGYSVKVGRFYEPWGLEGQTPSNYMTFLEFAAPVDTFYAFRTNGLGAWGSALDKQLHWGTSLTRSRTDGFGDSRNEASYAGSARLTGLPYSNEAGTRLVHVGVSGTVRSLDEIGYSVRPEAHTVEPFLDTGDATGGSPGDTFAADRSSVASAEAAVVWGPFSFQAEYFKNWIDDDTTALSDPAFSGYYVYATYWLTGEHRNFNKKKGLFGRPDPKSNFLEGGPGAWELAARYSTIDLDDGGLSAGELANVTLGVNWWMNDHVKVMLNYVTSRVDQGVDGADGQADFLGTRFQVDF